ncbi:hypothetical protein B0H13DRAFT_2561672 [Mycena leptocephala]|nr:hypothetical protein B0H13DRAFT_2561672 [Mycena leptocephala]
MRKAAVEASGPAWAPCAALRTLFRRRYAPTPLDSTPLMHTRRNHWRSSATRRSYTTLSTALIIAGGIASMTPTSVPWDIENTAPKFPVPLDSIPDWCGYSSSAGDPSSRPLASPSNPIASETTASAIASGSGGVRRPYCVSNFHPPPHRFDLTRCTKANRATPHTAGGQHTSSSMYRIASPSHRPRHSLPTHTSAKSKTSTRTPTAGARRKDGSRASAESGRRGISSAIEGVGRKAKEQKGGSGNRRTWDELVALDTVDQTLDKSVAHVEGRIEHKTSVGCRGGALGGQTAEHYLLWE